MGSFLGPPLLDLKANRVHRYPFHSSSGSNSMQARILLLKLLECMEEHGWTVYGSIDQKATTNEHRGETDTWHCCKMVGWQPGMPVYHN